MYVAFKLVLSGWESQFKQESCIDVVLGPLSRMGPVAIPLAELQCRIYSSRADRVETTAHSDVFSELGVWETISTKTRCEAEICECRGPCTSCASRETTLLAMFGYDYPSSDHIPQRPLSRFFQPALSALKLLLKKVYILFFSVHELAEPQRCQNLQIRADTQISIPCLFCHLPKCTCNHSHRDAKCSVSNSMGNQWKHFFSLPKEHFVCFQD